MKIEVITIDYEIYISVLIGGYNDTQNKYFQSF